MVRPPAILSNMRILSLLFLFAAPIFAGPIHGPILQWHEDPLTTMTLHWVEEVGKVKMTGEWQEGQAGFGYGDQDDATRLPEMKGNFSNLYIAREFELDQEKHRELALRIRYDDAFTAFINGKQVLQVGVKDGEIASHEAKRDEWETFKIDTSTFEARTGKNLICLIGHNRSLSSSDLTLHPELISGEEILIGRNATWLYLAGDDPESEWLAVLPELTAPKPKNISSQWAFRFREKGSQTWATASIRELPFADTTSVLRTVFLTDLQPETAYEFELNQNEKTVRSAWFQTAPSSGDNLSFVTGGDMGTSLAVPVCKLAGIEDPLFGLLGGDLAYANGKETEKWYDWIDNWSELVVSPKGRMIPMIVAIGNHETGSKLSSEQVEGTRMHPDAKFFYSLFELPDREPNYAIDFADYLSILLLDSNHTKKVIDQTEWLDQALKQRESQQNVFVCYHRPAFGTGVKDNQKDIIEHWVPLFQQYQVDCVFENDHHVYKRTWPLTDGKRDDEKGILYLGDGAWGANTREITKSKLRKVGADKYLARWSSVNHLIRVDLRGESITYAAKSADGDVFDTWP